jgi:hypothetical protein
MRYGLIITHAGSGGTLLSRILTTNYYVRSFGRTGITYDHPTVLKRMKTKINNVLGPNRHGDGDWYVDKLLFNYDFHCKPLYNICKFIYLIRSPQIPLATLIQRGYTPQGAETYYLFRLRRICEMAKNTPGGVLLTYEDLISKKAFPLLQNLFGLKTGFSEEFTPLSFDDHNLLGGKILTSPIEPKTEVPKDTLARCDLGYKKYLRFLESRASLIRFAVSARL